MAYMHLFMIVPLPLPLLEGQNISIQDTVESQRQAETPVLG